jgi:hypothetical protein
MNSNDVTLIVSIPSRTKLFDIERIIFQENRVHMPVGVDGAVLVMDWVSVLHNNYVCWQNRTKLFNFERTIFQVNRVCTLVGVDEVLPGQTDYLRGKTAGDDVNSQRRELSFF